MLNINSGIQFIKHLHWKASQFTNFPDFFLLSKTKMFVVWLVVSLERDKSVQFIESVCVCISIEVIASKLFFVYVYVWYRLHKSPKHLQNCHSSCRAKNLTNAVKHINKQWQRFQQNKLNPMRKKMATVNETAKSRVKKKNSRVIAATKFICFIKWVTTFSNINVLKIKSTFSWFMFIGCESESMELVNYNL